jgi:stage II sporulation protein D
MEKQAVTDSTTPSARDKRKSLAVWLSLAILLASTIAILCFDSRRDDSTPLQIQSARRIITPAPAGRPAPSHSSQDPAASPPIRVNVTPGGLESFRLEVRGPYTIRLAGSSRELGRGDKLAAATVKSTASGIKIGNTSYAATRIEIIPRQDPGVRVNDHLYRGTMRLFRRKDGQVSAVNVLPLEQYLASVVDSEMPAAFPESARKAQAIVARTYAIYQMTHADAATVYDLFASQRSQKYLGVEYTTDAGKRLAGESESSRRAVAETRGIVCTRRGQVFCTYYSAVCGGRTTNGAEIFPDAADVVKSVPCEWCRDSEYYRWTARFERRDFLDRTKPIATIKSVSSIRQTAGPGDGVVSRFRLADGSKSADVSGVDLRDRLGLRSPHFTLKLDKDQITADGRGHGHGVGFCQWGARGQGLEGKSAIEIVRHYYPGSDVVVVDY